MAVTSADWKELKRKTEKVYFDMYEGEGKDNPPVTTRLDRLEQAMSQISTLKWAVIVAVLAIIGDIVSNHVHF